MICTLCPRNCGAERAPEHGTGVCRMGTLPKIARAALHRWADDSDAGEAACDTLTAEALLAALSDEQHTLLGLRLDGYSVKEIAGRMGMSCAQVEDTFSCIRSIATAMA